MSESSLPTATAGSSSVRAQFTLTDYLDHQWRDELVGFPVPELPADARMAVWDDAGQRLPCQLAQRDGVTTAFFVVDDLGPLSSRRYTLTADADGFAAPFTECPVGEVLEIGNGVCAFRVPASRNLAAGDAVPAPLLGARRGTGGWIGQGRMALSTHLTPTTLETRTVESGPLWRSWELLYRFAGGETYRVTVKIFAGRSYLEITEASSLCRESRWEFSVRDGLQPDYSWTHPIHSNANRLCPLDYAKESGNLGAIQMPNYSGIWVPDDYYYFALFQREGARRDCLAPIGVTGGYWDYPYANQIDINVTPERDIYLRLSLTAGHRRWLLLLTDRDAVLDPQPYYLNPLNQAAKQYETPLDKVKDYVLAWEDVPEERRPFALADAVQLEHARTLAQAHPKLAAYRASLNPDLPGDYTYYHAGTHRTFDPDYRNDPATLYVTAETAAERKKQALFLKDVVLTGLRNRAGAMLDRVGHLDPDCASINIGRGLRPWVALYDFAAAEGVFSAAEAQWVRAVFAFFCYKIEDPDFWPADHLVFRDDHPRSAHRTHWFPRRQHDWTFYNIDNIPHNFHGDLWSAWGCIALTFPTHPHSRRWVERTLEFWEAELTYWVFPDGPWLESTTYTLNSFKDYLIYCRMLANARIRNYFTDERMQRAFRCVVELLCPYDARIGGTSLLVLGDANYPNSFGYVLGWMAGLAREDASFAALMNAAWKTTGEYLVEPGRFGLNFCDFLFQNPSGALAELPVQASQWYHGLGAFLRHAHRTPREIFIAIKAGIIYSHFHEPEGTFQLWWNSEPLCDEYGVQYGTGVNGVSASVPSCHNCVEIPGHPLTYNKGDITTFLTSDAFDYVVVEAPEQVAYLRENEGLWGFKGEVGPAGWHKRHFFFVKPYYLFIYDDLECPYPANYHLNVKADAMAQHGNHVHYAGRYGVDMEFLALDLNGREMRHSEFDVRPHGAQEFVPPEDFYRQLQLTIPGQPQQHFATLLVPHDATETVMVENDAGTGGAVVTREAMRERTMLFPRSRVVEDGNLVYHGQAGAVREDAGTLTLLQACGTRIGLTGTLVIDGDGPFTARLDGDGTLTLATDGVARWLTLSGGMFTGATGNLESLPDGSARLSVPAGKQTIICRRG